MLALHAHTVGHVSAKVPAVTAHILNIMCLACCDGEAGGFAQQVAANVVSALRASSSDVHTPQHHVSFCCLSALKVFDCELMLCHVGMLHRHR